MNVDTGLGQVCLAGQAQEVDEASVFPPTITFSYQSIGTITKADDKDVKADYVSVLLTLDITGDNVTPVNQTITADCKLDASLRQAGLRDKVRLRCDLGKNFAAFEGLTSANISSIDRAYGNTKRVKANSKNGNFKVTEDGQPTEDVGLTCNLDS